MLPGNTNERNGKRAGPLCTVKSSLAVNTIGHSGTVRTLELKQCHRGILIMPQHVCHTKPFRGNFLNTLDTGFEVSVGVLWGFNSGSTCRMCVCENVC